MTICKTHAVIRPRLRWDRDGLQYNFVWTVSIDGEDQGVATATLEQAWHLAGLYGATLRSRECAVLAPETLMRLLTDHGHASVVLPDGREATFYSLEREDGSGQSFNMFFHLEGGRLASLYARLVPLGGNAT